MPQSEPLLRTSDVVVRFGGNVAVEQVSIDIHAGQVTGLIGPNGAGKTTLYNCITGMQRVNGGSVHFDGHDITSYSSGKRARMGMARTFQRLELFLSLSVRDNIRVAGDIVKANHGGSRRKLDLEAETDRIVELTGLSDVAHLDVSDIPTGRARVVEVARALMTGPRLLLLDEPASGQTEAETERFAELLRGLADDGLAVCLVEHDLPLVMGLCSQIHVLDHGVRIASGTPSEIQNNAAVIEAYIGTEVIA